MAPVMSCLIPSNPDVSGIGVRIAIYIQNLLCFIPALWALWDGKVTNYEMDSAEAHSTTNLVLAFAILISCIFQALARGLTNYHGSIILSLSWMNNTNAFIYFLLYIQYKSQGEAGIKPEKSAWIKHIKAQVMTIFCLSDGLCGWWPFEFGGVKKHPKRIEGPGAAKVLFKRITLLLGSLHLTLMAALGIWLWSTPQSFGASETAGCVTQVADLAIVGAHIRFGSLAFRIASLTIYSLILIPGLNLILPMALFLAFHCWYHSQRPSKPPLLPEYDNRNTPVPVSTNIQDIQPEATVSNVSPSPRQLPPPSGVALSASIRQVLPVYVGLLFLLAVNIVFIADIELTLHRNGHLQTEEESQWGFGQILALLLIFMPLRDLVEALFRRRQEMQTKLNDALKAAIGEKNLNEIFRWVGAGANINVKTDESQTALDIAFTREDQHQLVSLLVTKGINLQEVLITAIDSKNLQYISRCATYGADVTVQGADGQTALDVAFTQEDQHQLVSLLATKGVNLQEVLITAIDSKNLQYISRCATYGADVTVQGADGRTALDIALLQEDQDDLVSFLVSKGASLSQALVKAINAQDCEHIARIVGAGADTNTEAPDGCTALDVALLRDDQDRLISLLVASGVDLGKGLIKAVNAKDCKKISVLVNADADVNAVGAGGLTALDVVLLQDGHDDLAFLLVAKGADLDEALVKAINAEDCERIARSVRAGADVNAGAAGGHTALDVALLRDNQDDLVSLLVERGADLNQALIKAINAKDCKQISRSVIAGADANVKGAGGQTALDVVLLRDDQSSLTDLLVAKGAHLNNALVKAINARDCRRISRSVIAGADINAETADGETALDVALVREDEDLIPLLVARGVNLRKAIVKAINAKNCNQIYRLVNAGADINAEGARSHTALDIALLQADQDDLVPLLLAKGADLDRALIKAIDTMDYKRISRSVNAGADINVAGAGGQTALDVALLQDDQVHLVALLATKGADLDKVLAKAIDAKDCERISRLVNAGGGINVEGAGGQTALDFALFQEDQDLLVSLLVAKGVDLDKALIKAIDANDCNRISRPIIAGADANVKGAGGQTALDVVLLSDDHDHLIAFLVSKGADLNKAFVKTIDANDCKRIFRLVTAGADINTRGDGRGLEPSVDIRLRAADGRTALDVAFSRPDQRRLIDLLVKKGVNLDRVLTQAITDKNLHYISQCVYYGARIDAKAPGGQTAFDVAFSREDQHHLMSLLVEKGFDLKKALIQAIKQTNWFHISGCVHYGADVNVKTEDGKTALEVTISEKKWDLVRSIVEAGANIRLSGTLFPSLICGSIWKFTQIKPSVSDGYSDPPLLAAYDKGAPVGVLELMLEKGADLNAQGGRYNRACLHEACLEGRDDVVSLLLRVKYRANPDIKDESQGPPLHDACRNGHTKCAQILLEARANINARNSSGDTALHWACYTGHVDCVKLLLKHGADTSIRSSSTFLVIITVNKAV
ncbi:hypothetical protein NMY22_g10231 [Coprinellus aureogranulatus]|nr:hypothetical protein NMY22_g10231 [Coprinellus aureogranulatus]